MTEQMTAYFHGNIGCQAAVVTAAVSTCTFSSLESGCGAKTRDPGRAQMTVIICSAKCCFHFPSMRWRCCSALRVCFWNLTFMTVLMKVSQHSNWMRLPVTTRPLVTSFQTTGVWLSDTSTHVNIERRQIFTITWLNCIESSLKWSSFWNHYYPFKNYCLLINIGCLKKSILYIDCVIEERE